MYKQLKKYLPFLRVNLMTMLTYRLSIVSWFLVEAFYFVMMMFLWLNIYSGTNSINGFTKEQMLFYFLMIGFLGLFSQAEAMFTLSGELRQGQISMYLIKPIHYKTRLFFEDLGRKVGISAIIIPINVIMIFILTAIFKIHVTFSLAQFSVFILYIPIAFLFAFEFSYLFGLLSIYTTNAFGLAILANIIMTIGNGGLIPLSFYPQVIQGIVLHLPFQYMSYYPTLLMLNKMSPIEGLIGLIYLLIWIGVFKGINHLLFRINEKKIVIFGG